MSDKIDVMKSNKNNFAKRSKEINKFSYDVDIAINRIKELRPGVYNRDILNVENIYDVINFIDNNMFIKEQLGKGIKLLTEFNDGYKGIRVYDYYKQQKRVDDTIENFYL